MPWIEVRFDTKKPLNVVHEDLCFSLGASAVTYLENGIDEIWEPAPNEETMFETAVLIALFDADLNIENITQSLQAALPDTMLQVDPLEDKEWSRAWMDQFEPMKFGQHLWVCPSWKTPPEPNACIIRLDPGIAFGTGTHPTTSMCLTAIDKMTFTDQVILDFGCGSGILGIAAALKGAATVIGVDHCEQAIQSTVANAKENDISEKCLNAYLPQDCPSIRADTTFANILAGPLIELAPTLLDATKPGGTIILSGLLNTQKPCVIEAYAPLATVIDTYSQEDWTCVILKKH